MELESYEIGIEPLFHQFNLEPRNFEPEQLRNMKSSRQSTVNRAWFPCSIVGTHMVCIPTLEHGNEKKNHSFRRLPELIEKLRE